MESGVGRVLRYLVRPPELSGPTPTLLLIALGLLVVSALVRQAQTDMLSGSLYSKEAITTTVLITAPVWEESWKVGLGVLPIAVLLCGFWIRQNMRGAPLLDIPPAWSRICMVLGLLVFTFVAVWFTLVESLGGGLDGEILPPLAAGGKFIGHAGFSLLAVLVALEGGPRLYLFLGLGIGFHSMVNFPVMELSGLARVVMYSAAHVLVVLIDGLVLIRWYPSIRAQFRRL